MPEMKCSTFDPYSENCIDCPRAEPHEKDDLCDQFMLSVDCGTCEEVENHSKISKGASYGKLD